MAHGWIITLPDPDDHAKQSSLLAGSVVNVLAHH